MENTLDSVATGQAIDAVVNALLEKLMDGTGEKIRTYRTELCVTEKQTRALVAISHIFPRKFDLALEILEDRKCITFQLESRKLYSVNNYTVCLRAWTCPCSDFIANLKSDKSRWQRACTHLIVAHLYDLAPPHLCEVWSREPIEVSADTMTLIALDGPAAGLGREEA